MFVGYARVSTLDQKLDRQIDQLEKYGIDRRNIYFDFDTFYEKIWIFKSVEFTRFFVSDFRHKKSTKNLRFWYFYIDIFTVFFIEHLSALFKIFENYIFDSFFQRHEF